MLTLVAMADTHLFHADLVVPDGDVLIHAGDMCRSGSPAELAAARDFLKALPHRYKIVVAGNHDRGFEDRSAEARALFEEFIYLQDSACMIEGTRFYGSPWTPAFNDWAFNLPRGEELAAKWALIPEDTDILITHGPPFGIGDYPGGMPERAGCEELLLRVQQIAPTLHLFGHIHQSAGRWQHGKTTFVNVTTDECLSPVTMIEYPLKAVPGSEC
jgi:Icc-related predicted phosphoesterase